jgi:hypothetical protein
VALTALTLTYFVGLLIKAEGAGRSTVTGAYDALLSTLAAVVLLAAVLLARISHQAARVVSGRSGGSGHKEELGTGLVENERGLRLTMDRNSLSESLLDSEAESDGANEVERQLAHERLRRAQLEGELSRARGEKEQAQRKQAEQEEAHTAHAVHAAELVKKQEARLADVENAHAAMQSDLQVQLLAEKASRERTAAEAVELRAELAQLKLKSTQAQAQKPQPQYE